MKVFISWSGEASRELAVALRDWFPKVLQDVKPFVSSKDIDKGANWIVELRKELTDSSFGVVCLTPDNILSPWLNYEAGAIATSIDTDMRVCPVLLGVEKSQVKPPLSHLQMTDLTRGDISQLMESMNKADGSPLDSQSIDENVEVWWSHLEDKVNSIKIPEPHATAQPSPEPPQPEMHTEEILEELLQLARSTDEHLSSEWRNAQTVEIGASRRSEVSVAAMSGLNVIDSRRRATTISIMVDKLPYPVPEPAYSEFSLRTRDEGHRIILEDSTGRSVIFERGTADEPPF